MLKKKWKGCMLLAVECFLILALLPGCFRREKMVSGYFGEEIRLADVEEGHEIFCGEHIALTPGVYQIRVWTALTDDQSICVNLEYEGAYYQSVRGNSVTFFSEDDYEDFEVYVFDRVQAVYVKCDFYNSGADGLVRLEVWKTSKGSRMLLFGTVMFCAALDFLVCFRRKILNGKISQRKRIVFWTLTAGVLLAYFPYCTDYFLMGEDSVFCFARISYLADALQQRNWLCTSVSLYIPAFFRMLGFSIMSSYKLFVLMFWGALAFFSYHALKKCVKDEYAALCGSIVHLLAPVQFENVYEQGNAEVCLITAFLPLVCCGVYLLYKEDVTASGYRTYKWYIVCGMSVILQSQMAAAGVTAVLILVYCGMFWKKSLRKQTACQLVEAAGIVLLINAWYWIPVVCTPRWNTVSSSLTCAPWVAVFFAMAAAVLFRKVQERGAICVKMALCIAMAVMVMATVYRVNDIVAKGNPVWLYNEENVGAIRAIKRDYALKEVADSCRPAAVAVSIAGTVAISGAYFWRKRKEEQDA